MSNQLLHEVGLDLEKFFEEMEHGARRPNPDDVKIFESAAFKNARPGTEQ